MNNINIGEIYINIIKFLFNYGLDINNKILIPIILFIDITHINILSRYVLEPINFILNMFINKTKII